MVPHLAPPRTMRLNNDVRLCAGPTCYVSLTSEDVFCHLSASASLLAPQPGCRSRLQTMWTRITGRKRLERSSSSTLRKWQTR